MGSLPFSIGRIPPTPGLVDQYFNDSVGEGDEGETDATGPWNEGGSWRIVNPPELEQGVESFSSGSRPARTPSAKEITNKKTKLKKSA